jgi:prepilin-type N-terminal cleavage/methylation domain-containing protein
MSTMMRRLRVRLIHDQRGLTLTEMMVTLVILAIIGTALVATTAAVSKALVREQTKGTSLDIARIGINRMGKAVRAGTELIKVDGSTDPAFTSIAPEAITMYVSFGPTPTKMTFSVNANRELVEQVWTSTGTGTAADQPPYTFVSSPRTTVIASKIPANTAVPLFKFLDSNGVALSTQTSTLASVTSLVRQVDVTLEVNSDPSRGAPSAVLNQAIVLPNLGVLKR